MNDAAAKVVFLAEYADVVAEIAMRIEDPFKARVFSRAVFLATDCFLVYAPYVKNHSPSPLDRADEEEIRRRIKKLRTDYEGCFAPVRDKLTGHQQELEIPDLFTVWNDVDTSTVHILRDDIVDIATFLGVAGALTPFSRPIEASDVTFLNSFASPLPSVTTPTVGTDRLAGTREQTVWFIPLDALQEKLARIFCILRMLQTVVALSPPMRNMYYARKAIRDLYIVDAVSLIDNVFLERSAQPGGAAADTSLVTMLQTEGMNGRAVTAFSRDVALEENLRDIRNRAAGHLDANTSVADIIGLVFGLQIDPVRAYLQRIDRAIHQICEANYTLQHIGLLQDRELRGILGVECNDGVKPFRH